LPKEEGRSVTSRAWDTVLSHLKTEVSDQVFETWLRPLRFVSREGSLLLVATPHKFFKQWIEENYMPHLEQAARKELGGDVAVEIVVGSEEDGEVERAVHVQEISLDAGTRAKPSRQKTTNGALNPRYTFDLFVVGAGNQFAHAASYAVANDPAKSYNPLFIYGGVGLGKTHLLNAIGNLAQIRNPRVRLCYITAEKFTNELIFSLRTNRMPDFKEKYRNVDMLLVDDVQFIAGKQRTQEEFFHTFNDLYSSRRQIVVSSDKFPKEIPDLEERIQSRFEWGLVADIQPPDLETRVAILNRKADHDQEQHPGARGIPHPDRGARLPHEEGNQHEPGARGSLPSPGILGARDLPRHHPQGCIRTLRREDLRPALRPQTQGDRPPAADRHVSHAGDDQLFLP
jgi:chromosomal replication initiator protein